MTVVGLTLGLTQLLKDAGFVTGQSLKVLAVLIGGIATYASIYHPEIWAQITPILHAIGITGGVSFLDSRIKPKEENVVTEE